MTAFRTAFARGAALNINRQRKGSLLIILAAVFWGISGISAQILYGRSDISTGEVIFVRLIFSGAILLFISFANLGKAAFEIWKSPRDVLDIILFSVISTIGVQYTFYAAIERSDSPTASVLQYVYPVLVIISTSVMRRKRPGSIQILTVVLAFLGTFLIATDGDPYTLSISKSALVWGLTSACCYAFYTIHSKRITSKYGSTLVNGWGMTLGGLFTLAFAMPDRSGFEPEPVSLTLLAVIIIIGTLLPFCLYLSGLQYVGEIAASALCSFETLTVLVLSALFLKTSFSVWELSGMFLIISTVIISSLSRGSEQKKTSSAEKTTE